MQERGKKLPEGLQNMDFAKDGSSTNVISEDQSNFDEDMFAAEDCDYEGSDIQDEHMTYEDDQDLNDGDDVKLELPADRDEELLGEEKCVKQLGNRRIKSEAWKHFQLNKDKTHSYCCYCQKDFAFCSSTTPMMRHLKSCHPAELQASIDESASRTDLDEDEDFKQESPDKSVEVDGFKQEVGLMVESQEPNGEFQKGLNNDSNVTSVRLGHGDRKRSAIWEYFVQIDKFTVSCNTCKNEVRAKGTTTNLIRHLEVYHKTVHAEFKDKSLQKLKVIWDILQFFESVQSPLFYL